MHSSSFILIEKNLKKVVIHETEDALMEELVKRTQSICTNDPATMINGRKRKCAKTSLMWWATPGWVTWHLPHPWLGDGVTWHLHLPLLGDGVRWLLPWPRLGDGVTYIPHPMIGWCSHMIYPSVWFDNRVTYIFLTHDWAIE